MLHKGDGWIRREQLRRNVEMEDAVNGIPLWLQGCNTFQLYEARIWRGEAYILQQEYDNAINDFNSARSINQGLSCPYHTCHFVNISHRSLAFQSPFRCVASSVQALMELNCDQQQEIAEPLTG